jgi:hypothetical protein
MMDAQVNLNGQFMEFWEYDNIPGFCFSGNMNYYKFAVNGQFINEIWNKNQMVLRGRENFQHPSMPGGRFSINSLDDYNSIKKQKIQSYKPLLYGSKINIDFRTYFFNSLTGQSNGNTGTYVVYSIPTKDTTYKNEVKDFTHEIGLFVFDQNFNPLLEKRDVLNDAGIRKIFSGNSGNMVNCVPFELNPRKISLAFDLRRMTDSNYYTYRKVLEIPKYDNQAVSISDLVLTNSIELEKELPYGIKRGGISFYPRLNNRFANGEPFYLFYEVYNLKLDEKKGTNFEQVITIKPKGEEGLSLKKIVKGITTLFTGEEGKVSLSTDFRTKEENTQVNMQLDISGYKPGKYDFIVTINDKISGKTIEKRIDLEIY